MNPTSPRRPIRRYGITSAIALVALLAGCGGDDATTEATATSAAPAPVIEVTDVWARSSPVVATAGAVYMNITNSGAIGDTLRSAAVDPSVAPKVELHETVQSSETTAMGNGSGSTEGGMMTMQPVDEIPVPAGETVVLEPGGYHVMVLDLVEPLVVGTSIEVTLTFELAGEQVVTADVLDAAP